MYLRTGRTAAAGRRPTAPMAIASSLGALPSRSSLVRSSTSRLGLLPQPPRFLSSTSRLGGLPPPDTTTVLRQPNGAPLYVVAPPRESFRQRVHRAFRKQIAASMRAAFILAGGLGGCLSNLTSGLTPDFGSKNRFPADHPKTRLSDVVGCDEAKAEVQEVIEYLKDPARFNRLGGKMPKGILLLGPPGVGKTLLARAVAGEAGVPFFAATGGDFEEMYVGVGAKRVRELFEAARKVKPSIVFIDEIDTVGGKRNDFDNPKTRMSLNQILTELDGFQESTGVIIIGATNFAEKLDPALLRPGRFDRHVTVSAPDIKGRRAILDLYASKIKLDPEVDLDSIARGTPGLTGADLFHLLNSASLRASTLNKPSVQLSDIEYAKDKILMGAERTTAKNSPEIKRRVAVYEGGKSLTAMLTAHADPLHKVTVIQRGSQLGKTTQQRGGNDDKVSNTYAEYLAKLDVLLGGRIAEQMVYGPDEITTTAAGDLSQASAIARQMVTAFGYGDHTGLRSHARTDFAREASNQTKADVDREVQRLLAEAYQRVEQKLLAHRTELQRITGALMEYEVLDGEQLKKVIEGAAIEKVAFDKGATVADAS